MFLVYGRKLVNPEETHMTSLHTERAELGDGKLWEKWCSIEGSKSVEKCHDFRFRNESFPWFWLFWIIQPRRFSLYETLFKNYNNNNNNWKLSSVCWAMTSKMKVIQTEKAEDCLNAGTFSLERVRGLFRGRSWSHWLDSDVAWETKCV